MLQDEMKRIDDQMIKVSETLDKVYLRKMQGDMHRCAAMCCDNDTYSLERVHNCIQNCNTPLNNARNYIEGEFGRLQDRLKRCVMDCNDNVKDKMGPTPTESEVKRYTDEFEGCASKCVDTYLNLLPALETSMKNVFASKKFG